MSAISTLKSLTKLKPFMESASYDDIREGDIILVAMRFSDSTVITKCIVGNLDVYSFQSTDGYHEFCRMDSDLYSYTILERKSPSHYIGDIVKDKNKSFWCFDGNTWACFGANKRITTEELYTELGPITLTSVYDA